MIGPELITDALIEAERVVASGNRDYVEEWDLLEGIRPLTVRAAEDMAAIVHIAKHHASGVKVESPVSAVTQRELRVSLDGEEVFGIHTAWQGGFLVEALQIDTEFPYLAILFGPDQYVLKTPLRGQHQVGRIEYLSVIADQVIMALMVKSLGDFTGELPSA